MSELVLLVLIDSILLNFLVHRLQRLQQHRSLNPMSRMAEVVARGKPIALRLLKWLSLLVLVLLLLVSAAWAALQFWVLPRANEWRPSIERQLSQALDVQVRIGHIEADTHLALRPQVTLQTLQVLDAGQREALRLDQVLVQFSPWGLLHGRLMRLSVEAPDLLIRRDAKRAFWVAGLPLSGQGDSSAATDWLFSQKDLSLTKGRLRWLDETGETPAAAFENVQLQLRNQGRHHAIELSASPPAAWAQDQPVWQLSVDAQSPWLRAHPGDWRLWNGQVKMALAELNVNAPLAYLPLWGQVASRFKDRLGKPLSPAQMPQGLASAQLEVELQHLKVKAASLKLDVPRLQQLQAFQLPADLKVQHLKAQLSLKLDQAMGFDAAKLSGFDFRVEDLSFDSTVTGLWPRSRLLLQQTPPAKTGLQTQLLELEGLHLGAVSKLTSLFALSPAVQQSLRALALEGRAAQVRLSWQSTGTLTEQLAAVVKNKGADFFKPATQFKAQGSVKGLGFAAMAAQGHLLRPGLRGLDVSFDVNHEGGRAQIQTPRSPSLRAQQAADQAVGDEAAVASIDLPGLLAGALMPLQHLDLKLNWRNTPESLLELQATQWQLANADLQAQGRFTWRPGQAQAPRMNDVASSRLGHLDLQATLGHLSLNRLHHYLPQQLPAATLAYLKQSLKAGLVENAAIKVQGPLADFPFDSTSSLTAPDAKTAGAEAAITPTGLFEVRAQLRGLDMAYAPDWPALRQAEGQFLLRGHQLSLTQVSAEIEGHDSWRLRQSKAQIADLNHPHLQLDLSGEGDTDDLLAFVQRSPLNEVTAHVFGEARATGRARLQMALNLPLDKHQNDALTLKGQLDLQNNRLQILPDAPEVSALSAGLRFNETGFSIEQAQAQVLGGSLSLSGGTQTQTLAGHKPERVIDLLVQGRLSAAGLQDLGLQKPIALGAMNSPKPLLALLSKLGQRLGGQTDYAAQLRVRGGRPDLAVRSDLAGLSLDLPAPLAKAAGEIWPLRLQLEALGAAVQDGKGSQDAFRFSLSDLVQIQYLRELVDGEPRVKSGGLALGHGLEETPLPETGVAAYIKLDKFDLSEWLKLLAEIKPAPVQSNTKSPEIPTVAPNAEARSTWQAYLPTSFAVLAKELAVGGRSLHQVVIGGSRAAGSTLSPAAADEKSAHELIWRANVSATELDGYVEYNPQANDVFARLSRLNLQASTAKEAESLLSETEVALPSMNVVVNDLEVLGRQLGRLELQARHAARSERNAERAWRIEKLDLTFPEGHLSGNALWGLVSLGEGKSALGSTAVPNQGRRPVSMAFQLDMNNAGAMLTRAGFKDLVAGGEGQLSGQLSWKGAPWALDYPSLNGQFKLNVETGRFLKADPGAAKLLGVLSLQSLARRLKLDFSDVFLDGFVFDYFQGTVSVENGVAKSNDLQMKNVNILVLMDGQSDLAKRTQDLNVLAIPKLDAGTASVVTAIVNPVLGLGTFLAQWALRNPLSEATTQEFHITGSWDDPKVQAVVKAAPVAK